MQTRQQRVPASASFMAFCSRTERRISKVSPSLAGIVRFTVIYHDKTLVYDDQIRVIEPLFCEQTDILLETEFIGVENGYRQKSTPGRGF